MKLQQLFSIFGKIEWGAVDPEHLVIGVHSDSRKITRDMVFVAVAGVGTDGHEYIPQAIDQGAIALVVESTENIPEDYTGVVMQVLDSKLALQELLSAFYAKPEERLIAIGITGTNGKTSSTYLIEAFLNEASVPCGVMGTIDHHFVADGKNKKWKSQLTTPDTNTFFERLNQFAELGAKAFVMEVSSHGLKQQRVPGHFDIAVFTNFSRDHLDYHKTMDDYFRSKQLLFTEYFKPEGETFAILNADDVQVRNTRVSPRAQKLLIGTTPDCDFSFKVDAETIDGLKMTVTEKNKGSTQYSTSLIGKHNAYNVVGAIAVARALGISHVHCQRALAKFKGIPGRLQRVAGDRRHAFVDYAHTPDALEKVLQALSALKGGAQLITIFGCGGDRDAGKRPMMGQIAQKYSDRAVVTSDNPRGEDPNKIIADILTGMDASRATVEADREKAFHKAIELSKDGDIILIAGKGHEDYQIVGSQTLNFSDYDKMKVILEGIK